MIRYFIILTLMLTSLYGNIKKDTLEIYFDTQDLYCLKNNTVLKYQAIKYLSKKRKKEKYDETIIYIDKMQKKHLFKVKHYNKVKFIEEKHPLLSLVKRKDRKTFAALLEKDGIKYPMKLKYVLQSYRKSNLQIDEKHEYKILFEKNKKDDILFTIKFQYPYFLNLFYAICFSLLGLMLIKIMLNKRLKKRKI